MEIVEDKQDRFCRENKVPFVASPGSLKTGVATSTLGQFPWNGMRHPVEGGTSGWYLWCGEQLSDAPDFFSPIHTLHIYEEHPELIELLGMAPGYRFLLAPGYLDIWYDPALLLSL